MTSPTPPESAGGPRFDFQFEHLLELRRIRSRLGWILLVLVLILLATVSIGDDLLRFVESANGSASMNPPRTP